MYDLSTVLDFTSAATEFLQFHLFENATPGGAWSYSVTVEDTGAAASATTSGAVVGGGSGILNLEDSDFGGGTGFASTIDRISITVTGPAGGVNHTLSNGVGARIVAVPEPSAIALLGLTGIGGVMFARRRRKAQKAQKTV